MQVLQGFGITRVPAVVVGDQAVHGWNPQGVAALVGVDYDPTDRLSPEALTERLDTLLVAAQRAIRQFPTDKLGMKSPGRDRSARHLSYHIFRIAQSYRDTIEQGYLSEKWFGEGPPDEMQDAAAIARHGESVRQQLLPWLAANPPTDGDVNTYYGPQSMVEFYERTVWHVAQHLRQLYALLEMMQITPDTPLTADDFQGLPLPENIW
jgi:hypothetical protein